MYWQVSCSEIRALRAYSAVCGPWLEQLAEGRIDARMRVVAMLFPFLTVGLCVARTRLSFLSLHQLALSFSSPLSFALFSPLQNPGSGAPAPRALRSLTPRLIARTWRRYDQDPSPTFPTAPRRPQQQASSHQAHALATVRSKPPLRGHRPLCTPWRATSLLYEPTMPSVLASPKSVDAPFHFQDDSRYGNSKSTSIPPSISDKVLGPVFPTFRSCLG